ncbi:hypothetical protein [Chryseobacterium sp.]|uniref:hypothetical protein n=1 Tax=Chryseobacterium sp. TaxID=1871047 RepID=UPI0035B0E519
MQESEKNKRGKKDFTKFGDNPLVVFELNFNSSYPDFPKNKISMENIILSPQAYAKVIEKLEEMAQIINYYADNPEESGREDVNEITLQSFADAVEKGARFPL